MKQGYKFLSVVGVTMALAAVTVLTGCKKDEGEVGVIEIKMNTSTANVMNGDTLLLTYKVITAGAVVEKEEWTTSDATVASVDQKGVVKGLKEGTATVKVTVNGQFYDCCNVTVVDNDLSINGTANCYVVSKAGKYCFNAAVKGGSTESVGKPSCAAVLWESFGTDEVPVPGDVVSNVSYSNGKVFFTSGRDGNAVIAVKDPSNVILWSWHIWVCEGFDPAATAQVYNNNAGTMMDRSLGATSVTPGDLCASGLLYQWGRKDPFLGCDSTVYVREANVKQVASTGAWESATPSYTVTGTIEYVTRHPMQFITYNEYNRDWYYTGDKSTDDTRWQASDQPKSMYDPCPEGWRVPDGGSGGVWATALGSDEQTRTGPWDPEKQGMNFGSGAGEGNVLGNYPTVWYPAVACIDIDGKLYRMDKELKKELNGWYGWWSCTPAQGQPYSYCFLNSLPAARPDVHVVAPKFTYGRACAFSVRCVQEQ